jgi:hypothetical protein
LLRHELPAKTSTRGLAGAEQEEGAAAARIATDGGYYYSPY